jgi:hypothetical protein
MEIWGPIDEVDDLFSFKLFLYLIILIEINIF